MRDSVSDHNDLQISLPAVKTIKEYEERLDKLQRLYIREAHRFKRQLELSQTREEICHCKNCTFTPVRPLEECNHRVQFD